MRCMQGKPPLLHLLNLALCTTFKTNYPCPFRCPVISKIIARNLSRNEVEY